MLNQVNANTKQRIASIDTMRGLVILLMMLDHVCERFFLHTRRGDPMAAIQIFGSVPMFAYIVQLCILLAGYWVLY